MSQAPTLISFITSDNVNYLLDHQFFGLHSKFVRDLELDTVRFSNINSGTFKYIVKYLEVRKIHPETNQLPKPLPVGQLKDLIHELDYDLVEEISEQGPVRFQEIIRACTYLQIEYLKKILLVGFALKYLNKNPQEIREYYNIQKLSPNEEAEYKQRLSEVLKHIKPQEQPGEEQ